MAVKGAFVPVLLSVLFTVKLNVPAALAVPLKTPVAPFKVSPVGNAPALIVY